MFPKQVEEPTGEPHCADYVYEKFEAGNQEIRLITLEPPLNEQDAVHYRIFHTKLQNAGDSMALSHVWSDPKHTAWVWVNGGRLKVTINLLIALGKLRALLSPYKNAGYVNRIWVDALCINQQDLDERASQVCLMGQVYSNANFTVGWIGASTKNTERTLRFIGDLAAMSKEDIDGPTAKTSRWIAQHTSPVFRDCQWMAVAELFNREWFTRTWIVQEVALSRTLVILCGRFSCKLTDFWHAVNLIMCNTADLAFLPIKQAVNNMSDADINLARQRSHILAHSIELQMGLLRACKNHTQRENAPSFYDIMGWFFLYNASDLRDKLYAFRSLCSLDHSEILSLPIDYTTSVAELYTSFFRRHLEVRKSLGFLSDCSSDRTLPALPSWVPTLSLNLEYDPLSFLETFNACKDTRPQYSFGSIYQQLFLRGLVVDNVTAIGEAMGPLRLQYGNVETEQAKVIRSWEMLVDPDVDQSNRIQSVFCLTDFPYFTPSSPLTGEYITGTSNSEAFTRLILCNHHGRLNVEYNSFPYSPNLQPYVDRVPQERELVLNLMGRAQQACTGKRFFITSKGYYGLGRPEITIGDKIGGFLGATVPFASRSRDNHNILIGECYVQGLMAGEAIEQMERGEVNACELELR